MLERLLQCETVEDFTDLGATMCFNHGVQELQGALLKERMVFRQESAWTQDKMNLAAVTDLIQESKAEEDKPTAVLHRLQILKQLCPAIAMDIVHLLRKTSC